LTSFYVVCYTGKKAFLKNGIHKGKQKTQQKKKEKKKKKVKHDTRAWLGHGLEVAALYPQWLRRPSHTELGDQHGRQKNEGRQEKKKKKKKKRQNREKTSSDNWHSSEEEEETRKHHSQFRGELQMVITRLRCEGSKHSKTTKRA
jgi:hypothetical protein